MITKVLIGAVLVVGLTCVVLLVMRYRFMTHLDTLEANLRQPVMNQAARTDLPAEVVALAARLGARPDGSSGYVTFKQTGQMWQAPGAKPMGFTANQTIRLNEPGFLWRASFGGMILVADYFVSRSGGMEVMLLGAVPITSIVHSASANKGEIMRYLAELPLSPDAILFNKTLDWTVIDTKTIKVAAGTGESRGEVTLYLDDSGLISRMRAESRPYAEKGEHPWQGRFWDYQTVGGRTIPIQAEVAWDLDAGEFVYWRGKNLDWRGG